MAENLQLLKKRIRTATNIAQIAKAMEMIAASKIHRAQIAVEKNRPYAGKISTVVERLLGSAEPGAFDHPFLRPGRGGRKLLIVLAPDKGMCGGLPGNLLRKLGEYDPKETLLVVMGKKAEKFAARRGYDLAATFKMGTVFPSYGVVYPLLEIINRNFSGGLVSSVDVLFTEFKSMISQAPVAKQLLPVAVPPEEPGDDIPYIFEPGAQAILNELLPYYVETILYNFIIQAYTSEQAARMVAMKNAKDNALEITDFLTNSYNRSRQERITGEILDLANGQIA